MFTGGDRSSEGASTNRGSTCTTSQPAEPPALSTARGSRQSRRCPRGWLLPLLGAPICFFALAYLPTDGGATAQPARSSSGFCLPSRSSGFIRSPIRRTLAGTDAVGQSRPRGRVGARMDRRDISLLGLGVFAPIGFRLYNAGHLHVSSGIRDAPHMAAPLGGGSSLIPALT
jgi:hypothetical protein